MRLMDTLDPQKILTAVLGLVFALYMGLLTWNAVRMVDKFEALENRVRNVEIREAGSATSQAEVIRRLGRMEELMEKLAEKLAERE